jgi:gas vesicle protein
MTKSTKKLAIAAGAGLIGGLAAGLLFAPKSGKQTREDIKIAVGKAQKSAIKTIHKVDFEIKSLIKKLEPKMTNYTQKAKDGLIKTVEKAKKASKQAATVLSAFREGTASDKDLDAAIKELKAAKEDLVNYLKK